MVKTDLLVTLRGLAETRHQACLEFSESVDVLMARLGELSGTRLPVGRGILPSSLLIWDGAELRVSEFGRTPVSARVEPRTQGAALIVTTTAPLLRAGVFLWSFTLILGLVQMAKLAILVRGISLDVIAQGFCLASLVGTLVFPPVWGRYWAFQRIVAGLSERLRANNHAQMMSCSRTASLSRQGAWTSGVGAFVWAPIVAMRGFPVPLTGTYSSTPPWINGMTFLTDSISIELAMVLLFPLVGWIFIGGGAICGYAVARLYPQHSLRFSRITTVIISALISLAICWQIGGSRILGNWFYMP